MNTRDGYRLVLGYIGIVAGGGSLIGYGAPSVNGFFHAVLAQRFFEALLLVGGLLCWASFAVSRGRRVTRDDVERGRRSDLLEALGITFIALCALVAAWAALTFTYHGSPGGPPVGIRRTLQASSTVAFETGAAFSCLLRLRRLLDRDIKPLPEEHDE